MAEKTVDRPIWTEFQQVAEQTKQELGKKYHLLATAMSWFKAVEGFRKLELEEMVLKDPDDTTRHYHRATVSRLIADGENLVLDVMLCGGLPEGASIKMEDILATVQELYHTQAEWHGGMTAARKRDIEDRIRTSRSAGI